MTAVEQRLKQRIETEVSDLREVTPSLLVDVHQAGQRIAQLSFGESYTYYDLASLTKVIFTASAAMIYFSENRKELTEPLRVRLPWWKPRSTTPYSLFTHTAGLEWWVPMYKKLKGPLEPEVRWQQLKKQLAKVHPRRRKKAVYSDLDLWLIGVWLETATGKTLMELWERTAERCHVHQIFFHPGNQPLHARELYAPTENCPWRKKVLQGEVHDENAWSFGGVAPHAGLFGDLESVSAWGLELRRAHRGESSVFGRTEIVRYFTGRRLPRTQGDWGLGFMKPSRPRSSCGRYFSLTSFGHTGFTGTSIWFDPKRDLLVTILSNRVHPTRKNNRFVELRPRLHDWIVESL